MENITRVIITVAVVFFVTATMKYLYKESMKELQRNEEGKLILRYSKLFNILGCFFFIIGIFLFILIVLKVAPFDLAIIIFATLFSITGACFVLLYKNAYIKADENEVISLNLFKKKSIIGWKEVREVSFELIARRLILKGSQSKVVVSADMVGFNELIILMKKKIDESLYKIAIEKFTSNNP